MPGEGSDQEAVAVTGSVRSLKGLVPGRDVPVTQEEMDAAIAEAASNG